MESEAFVEYNKGMQMFSEHIAGCIECQVAFKNAFNGLEQHLKREGKLPVG